MNLVGIRQYSRQREAVSAASGNRTPTHVGKRKGCIVFLHIDFSDRYLNEIMEPQTYLRNTAMLHSAVTGAVGDSEVNRCADKSQRWAITKALTEPSKPQGAEGSPIWIPT